MEQTKITKSMGILEAVKLHPDIQRYFAMAGMSCFGCMAAQYENIEEGCLAHGIDPDVFVRNLNFFISGQKPTEDNLPST
ncbi:DUF1858 domain-containing protein [Pseudoramibacter sp.]|jgi:hybrid cluster-associated redox disulfide protein|uniref:DUF1858 domain-containing protein n=1 Tax=Pseudoramibacter sp. TaxID=2034862 RepID=UPI0025E0F4A4|nr:DUF1858 domain-containing protein [Pseudoramibacter sp.]MCH4073104.1 DUF1858 domain-containing protein [Pseudoramibacter sp.]MCH4106877.1 DUF1858 domain-containing protein [Pseudoramibacter sp.]